MKSGVKKYNTAYKKRVLERDTYLPLLSPKGIIQCSGCGAFYYRRHWTLNPPSGFSYPVHAHPIYCAACRKIRDRFPGAELQLLGVEAGERGEIVRILRNEEERAREKNPLERIMRFAGSGGQLEGGDDHGKACAKTWPFDQKGERRQHRLQVGS
jgi:hypothetical protein